MATTFVFVGLLACGPGAPVKLSSDQGAAKVDPCATSDDCTLHGRCETQNGACAPTTNEHCAASDDCRRNGLCVLGDGECARAEGAVDCAESDMCRLEGHCNELWGGCVAQFDEDCAQSVACAQEKRCVVEGAECVRDSEE